MISPTNVLRKWLITHKIPYKILFLELDFYIVQKYSYTLRLSRDKSWGQLDKNTSLILPKTLPIK